MEAKRQQLPQALRILLNALSFHICGALPSPCQHYPGILPRALYHLISVETLSCRNDYAQFPSEKTEPLREITMPATCPALLKERALCPANAHFTDAENEAQRWDVTGLRLQKELTFEPRLA